MAGAAGGTLDDMQQPNESPAAVPVLSRPRDTMRVLVVDDDPTATEAVSGYLDRAG